MPKGLARFDKVPLDVSRAYYHKTLVGGIFSLIYIIGGLIIFTLILYDFVKKKDTLTTYQISGIEQNGEKDPFSGLEIPVDITVSAKATEENFKKLFSYYTPCIYYLTSEENKLEAIIETLDYNLISSETKSQILFKFTLQNKHFQSKENESPKLVLLSCQSLNLYKTKGLAKVIDSTDFLTSCNPNNDEVYEFDFIKGKDAFFHFSANISFSSLNVKKFVSETKTKEYDTMFKIRKGRATQYQLDEIKMMIRTEKGLLWTRKKREIFINWRYPERKEMQGTYDDQFQYSLYFSSRGGDTTFVYIVSSSSIIDIIIDLGGLLKIYAMLTVITGLWKFFYKQKAFLVLSSYFKVDEEKGEVDPIEEKLNNSSRVNWNEYSFCDWFGTTFCCCCSSRTRRLRKEKLKALNSLETASFIRYGFESKWVDIGRYMPENKPKKE